MSAASPNFTKKSCGHPHEPDDTSHDTIGDLAFACVVRQSQTKATVDNAKGDHDAAKPEMRIRSSLSTLIPLEESVVNEP